MFKLLVVIILIETLHILSILIFACTYFCELKKITFREYLCLQMASFWKFEFINFRPKEKRKRKRQLNQRICERQHDNGKTGRSQWKNCCYWLILKKTALTNIFCIHVCIYIYMVFKIKKFFMLQLKIVIVTTLLGKLFYNKKL